MRVTAAYPLPVKRMADFLTTAGVACAIDNILASAKQEVVLISPYIKLNPRLMARLRDCGQREVPITFVYGKSDLCREEEARLRSIAHLRLYYYEHLHAKCYLNEHTAIITSMNLYAFSEQTNAEMGVELSLRKDRLAYRELREEVEAILRGAECKFGAPVQAASRRAAFPSQSRTDQRATQSAEVASHYHCIRCRSHQSSSQALCGSCYEVWARWENPSFPERWCQRCGEAAHVSYRAPECKVCRGGGHKVVGRSAAAEWNF